MIIPSTLQDIERLVTERTDESKVLDFKRDLPEPGQNQDMGRAICAMANAEGGVLVYGIGTDESDRASGLSPVPLNQALERAGHVAEQIDEPVRLDSQSTTIESPAAKGTGFLVLVVSRSRRRPHFFENVAWSRGTKKNERLTRREIGKLFAELEGFAEEFGLIPAERPAEIRVTTTKEQRFNRSGSPETHTYLVLSNAGDQPARDVAWTPVGHGSASAPPVFEDPFPVDLPPKHSMRVSLHPHNGLCTFVSGASAMER